MKKLTDQQMNAVRMLVYNHEGKTTEEIAQAVGVSRSTLWRWRTEDQVFRDVFEQEVDNKVGQMQKVMVNDVDVAVKRLIELMNSDDENVSLRATNILLEYAMGKPTSQYEINATQEVKHNTPNEEDILSAFD